MKIKRRSQTDWQALIAQQSASNLSVAEFCKQNGLGQTYFYKRKSELKTNDKLHSRSGFVKIQPPFVSQYSNSPIEIQHQQSKISLHASISPLWLAEFVKALA